MKNKKSKIIIPAMGLILLSTAASISGSVAWFTAQRTGQITAGQFAVTKGDGNLSLSNTAGVGTKTGANNAINPKIDEPQEGDPTWIAQISDVSFNPQTKQLWNDNDGGTGRSFVQIGDTDDYQTLTEGSSAQSNLHKYVLSESDHTYYAFTWKTKVSYAWGSDHTALNVFFDYANSNMTGTDQDGATGTGNTYEGFRIAIIGTSNTVVYSKYQGRDNLKTVTVATEASEQGDNVGLYKSYPAESPAYSYFASDYYGFGGTNGTLNTSYAANKAIDRANNQQSREDYLGTIQYNTSSADYDSQTNSNSIDLYFVAWFEGTDGAVIDASKLQQVQSTLAFYSCINGTNE